VAELNLTALGLRLLGDDPKDVSGAAEALAGSEAGFSLIWSALMHRPGNARSLIPPLARAPVDTLLAAASQSLAAAEPGARVAIVHVLAGARDPRASELLMASLEDVAVEVRIAALRALAERGQAVPAAVIRCRKDASVEVREAVVQVLADLRTGEAVDHLIHHAADPSPEVRAAARAALAERRAEEVARSALRALRDPLMRRAAIGVLGDLGAGGAPLIVAELSGAGPEVKDDLEEALRMGGGVERSLADLRHPSAATRTSAVQLLGLLGAGETVPQLIEALSDPSPSVRVQVIGTLASLDKERRSMTRLKEVFLGDPDLDVVAAAEAALRAIEGTES
jgi:HEAT repeat protein